MSLLHFTHATSPIGAHNLEKQIFGTAESLLLRQVIGSQNKIMFEESAIMNALPVEALDSILRAMRNEVHKLHYRLRDKPLDESLSTKSWTSLGRTALEVLGIIEVESRDEIAYTDTSTPANPPIDSRAAKSTPNRGEDQGQENGAEIEDFNVGYRSTGEIHHTSRIYKPQAII